MQSLYSKSMFKNRIQFSALEVRLGQNYKTKTLRMSDTQNNAPQSPVEQTSSQETATTLVTNISSSESSSLSSSTSSASSSDSIDAAAAALSNMLSKDSASASSNPTTTTTPTIRSTITSRAVSSTQNSLATTTTTPQSGAAEDNFENLQKAVTILANAKHLDELKRYDEALKMYRQGVDMLLEELIIRQGTDQSRTYLRDKCNDFMNRIDQVNEVETQSMFLASFIRFFPLDLVNNL